MQASLEAESRGKLEAMKMKKKLESDINELEVALDGANRGRAEAEKNIKRYQQQVREIQQVRRGVECRREPCAAIDFLDSVVAMFTFFCVSHVSGDRGRAARTRRGT